MREPQKLQLTWSAEESELQGGSAAEQAAGWGTVDDQLPFAPTSEKVASIAWRTWIYSDTGPARTRLGYLRAGQIVDARGPLLVNAGCAGGWLRINPRGFVCLGKGATQDLTHPVVVQGRARPVREGGFPYRYGKSDTSRPPERYFRLPTKQQMIAVEGADVLDRGARYLARAQEQGWLEKWEIEPEPPEFLREGRALVKPYGTKSPLRTQVHAGRMSRDSGYAFAHLFQWEGRAFGLTTEMDILPLDRVHLKEASSLVGVQIPEGGELQVAFHVKGYLTLWERTESGAFRPHAEQREKRGFLLTGQRATGGMLETSEGLWVPESGVRVLRPRSNYPSFATGSRKWIDISIQEQSLVAYEGQQPVYATLVSTGKGGLGDPETELATVRGTFMIYEKSVSSTMDGDDDQPDGYELLDVPYVQYFHRGYALHGAYWHDEFGRARSQGCINLTAQDSAWIFDWTDPPVPEGWHAVLNKERGTVVHVRR